MKNGNSYSLKTPNDWGTGTAEKSMIFFDMSVLELTCLPAIAHDTVVFANLDTTYLKQIILLYRQTKKQIFISFEKYENFSDTELSMLKENTVIELGEGTKSLFGKTWREQK